MLTPEALITSPFLPEASKHPSLIVQIARAMNELGIDPRKYCPTKTVLLVQTYLSLSQLRLYPLAQKYHQERYRYAPLLVEELWSEELEKMLQEINLGTPPEIELDQPRPAILFSNLDGRSMKEGEIEPVKVELAQLDHKHQESGEIIARVYPLCQAQFGTTEIQITANCQAYRKYIPVTSRSIYPLL